MNNINKKATQLFSHMFSQQSIVNNTYTGSHNGESNIDIVNKIMTNPHIQFEEDSKKSGVFNMYYTKDNINSNTKESDGIIDIIDTADTSIAVKPETSVINKSDVNKKLIGWADTNRYVGWIDSKSYDSLVKDNVIDIVDDFDKSDNVTRLESVLNEYIPDSNFDNTEHNDFSK